MPYTPPKQLLNAPPLPQKALTLSRNVDECKPLNHGGRQLETAPAPIDVLPSIRQAGQYYSICQLEPTLSGI
jgi:hypothetical protein